MKLMSEEQMMVLLPAELESIALNYCGAIMADRLKDTVIECYEFLRGHYGTLAFPEIKRAFELAAAGTIEAELKAYNGNFTVRILGHVLKAYMGYRNRLQNRLLAVEKETKDKEMDMRISEYYKSEEGQAEISLYYEKLLEKHIAKDNLEIKDVTSRMYLYLEKKGLISLTPEEKRAYFKQGKELYIAELVNEKAIAKATSIVPIQEILKQIAGDQKEETKELNEAIHARCVVLAQRLVVLDYVKRIKNQIK